MKEQRVNDSEEAYAETHKDCTNVHEDGNYRSLVVLEVVGKFWLWYLALIITNAILFLILLYNIPQKENVNVTQSKPETPSEKNKTQEKTGALAGIPSKPETASEKNRTLENTKTFAGKSSKSETVSEKNGTPDKTETLAGNPTEQILSSINEIKVNIKDISGLSSSIKAVQNDLSKFQENMKKFEISLNNSKLKNDESDKATQKELVNNLKTDVSGFLEKTYMPQYNETNKQLITINKSLEGILNKLAGPYEAEQIVLVFSISDSLSYNDYREDFIDLFMKSDIRSNQTKNLSFFRTDGNEIAKIFDKNQVVLSESLFNPVKKSKDTIARPLSFDPTKVFDIKPDSISRRRIILFVDDQQKSADVNDFLKKTNNLGIKVVIDAIVIGTEKLNSAAKGYSKGEVQAWDKSCRETNGRTYFISATEHSSRKPDREFQHQLRSLIELSQQRRELSDQSQQNKPVKGIQK